MIGLLEEAVELLRDAPAQAWAMYLTGAVPFFSALLFFWSSMTGSIEAPNPLGAALVVALLFGAHQFTKTCFARLLYSSLAGPSPDAMAWARNARIFVLAWFSGVLRLPLLVVPALPVIAFFRIVTVLAAIEQTPSPAASGIFRRAAALAGRGGGHTPTLVTMVLVAIVLWLNVFTGMLVIPFLFRVLTGQQLVLTRNPGALLNGTMLFASFLAAWALIDVMMTAVYVCRVFHGESEETGADLLAAWRRAVSRISVTALLISCFVPAISAQATGQGSPAGALDHAIDQVLAQKAYQWRKPPVAGDRQNAFVRWTDSLLNSMGRARQWLRRQWRAFLDWMMSRRRDVPQTRGVPPTAGLRIVAWFVIAALAGALIVLLLRSRWMRPSQTGGALAPVPAPLDLEDPSLVASQLPEDEWLSIARQWLERADYRMALRAYFLANLAFLGSRDLVSINRSKTDLEYLRELKRRARNLTGMDALFAANLSSFENAWYGLHTVASGDVNAFAGNLERMRALAG